MTCQIVRAAEAHYGRSVTLEEACRYGWEYIRLKVKGGSWRVYVGRQIAGLASDDLIARQTSSFTARKDSAGGEATLVL